MKRNTIKRFDGTTAAYVDDQSRLLSYDGSLLTNLAFNVDCFVDITSSSVVDDIVTLVISDKTVTGIIDGTGRQWPCLGEDEVVIVGDGVVQVDLSYLFNKLNITSIPIGETWQLVLVGGL